MSSDSIALVTSFLANGPFAVVGASANPLKYGNKVLRCYQQHKLEVYPVNPKADRIEGLKSYSSLSNLPRKVKSISIITPPEITEKIVLEAIKVGVKHIWMQPGAESDEAIRRVKEAGLELIAGGPCILVTLGFKES